MEPPIEFCLLGSFEVRTNGRLIRLPGGKPRALLAALLLRRNEVVAFDQIVDDLWGEKPPPTARQMVKGYVFDLRRGLAAGADAPCLVTHSPGYRLDVHAHQVDADQFERLLERGAEAFASQRHSAASHHLRDALALWRGPPLVDFLYERFAAGEIRRLEDLRLVALELRIAADLELGRHAQLVGELQGLVRDHPLRERLCELLMLALYRSDRGAEALEAYTDLRVSLDELGLEPGPTVRRLQPAILRHDPDIGVSRLEAVAVPEPAVTIPPTREIDAPLVSEERRKMVTFLFCDVEDSTGLGEQIDTELRRDVLERFFSVASPVLLRHGATVDKHVGYAVVAVFGVPTVHEDDSLRAVRAAVELRTEVAKLNDSLEAEAALFLTVRIALNTGEIVVGDAVGGPAIFAAEASSVAARLQQAAQPNEILIGETTAELVRGAVELAPIGSRTLNGKSGTMGAFRLLGLTDGAPAFARQFDAPLVGRLSELDQVRDAFGRCVDNSSVHLFTVLGPAGIGKSRLGAEAQLELAEPAGVFTGACLSYGEGITFWPLRQVLAAALGEPIEKSVAELFAGEPNRDWFTASIARLAGVDAESHGSLEESFFAVRCVLERLAVERPLVLVFEDLHWAEPALLDLIEHIADLARAAPIFLLCVGRAELLEHRPAWAGGKPNATTLLLEPLSSDDSVRLADWLLRDTSLEAGERARVLELAEGNPLFIEQLCAHASDNQGRASQPALPPTVLALLAARIDRLAPAERAVVDRAAIIGDDFDVAALTELAPSALRPLLRAQLESLVRKELIRPPARSRQPASYRFRHALVRDAAYRSISKAGRAELHERYAQWLDQNRSEEEFCDELVGHHLEQAYRCRVDLGKSGPETFELAGRASARLQAAARHAQVRSDRAATASLLERAAALLPASEPRRLEVLADLAASLTESGELERASEVLHAAESLAAAGAETVGKARLDVEAQLLQLFRSTASATGTARRVARDAYGSFERAGDHRGLSRAARLSALADWVEGRAAPAADAWEQAAEHARLADDRYDRADLLAWIAAALWLGPSQVAPGIVRCEEIREEVEGHRIAEAAVLRPLGALYGLAGDFVRARSYFAESASMVEELGLGLSSASSHQLATTEMLAGNFDLAAECLRSEYEHLESIGENSLRSTTAALLARACIAQHEIAEAERFASVSEALAQPDDVLTQILWRGVRTRLLALDECFEAAELVGREGALLAAKTDFTTVHADALVDLASSLSTAGRTDDASVLLARAEELYKFKGNAPASARARQLREMSVA